MAASRFRRLASVLAPLPLLVAVNNELLGVEGHVLHNVGHSVPEVPHDATAILVARPLRLLKRNDLVAVSHPHGDGIIVGRLVGGPGDLFQLGSERPRFLQEGQLCVVAEGRGHPLNPSGAACEDAPLPLDSRTFGAFPSALTLGKPVAVLWPPSAVKLLR